MANANGPRKVSLSANPTPEALAALNIGDIVYLTGTVYTAREGVYMRV
ncbi:MAG: fumarate hydratase, partial [Candidatus Puniceispirillum sp.]